MFFFFLLTFFYSLPSPLTLLFVVHPPPPWSLECSSKCLCLSHCIVSFFSFLFFLPLSLCIFPYAVLPSNCGILQEHIFTQTDSYTHIFSQQYICERLPVALYSMSTFSGFCHVMMMYFLPVLIKLFDLKLLIKLIINTKLRN